MNKVLGFRCLGILLAWWLMSSPACAQSELRKANEHFRSYEFARAIAEYQKVLQSRPASLALAQNLAHAYRLNNNSREAEAWFAKVLTFPGYEPLNIYHYAEALKSNGKYAEARAQYQAYAAKVPAEGAMVDKRIQSIDLALTWLHQPAPVELQPVKALNSDYADFSPVFFDNGIVFASDRPLRAAAAQAGWTGRPYVQLFYAKKENAQAWGRPTPLEPTINSATHNGPAVAEKDNLIYFTRTFISREKQQGADTDPTSWTDASGPANGLVNRLAIYSVEKRNGKWINLRPFAYNKVAQYSAGHPALSPDGRFLYFVSDMPGGKGQTDIYYCERRTGGSWSRPQNAGPAVNTSGRESFPVIAADGTLYFSSDGHPGMGGLDLFSAKGEKAAWREVVNLKPPYNSAKDDFGILWEADGLSGYLSSNRESADGTDNIYAFKPASTADKAQVPLQPDTLAKPAAAAVAKPVPVENPAAAKPTPAVASAPVVKPATAPAPVARPAAGAAPTAAAKQAREGKPAAVTKPAPATKPAAAKPAALSRNLVLRIRTRQQGPGQTARVLPAVRLHISRQGSAGDSLRVSSGARGVYGYPAARETTYIISAAKPGYLKQTATVSTAGVGSDTLQVELLLHRAEAEVPIVLNNIYFDLDKADIRLDASGELDKLVDLLQANPRIRIEISAHSDSRESQAYNLKLSQRRADAVLNYLVSKGVPAGRLTARGYGESRLVNQCRDGRACPEAQHQLNRRTEFKIRK